MTPPRRGRPVDTHHLWLKRGVWYIRAKLPEQLGGGRVSVCTKTSDIREAVAQRDRLLGPLLRERNAIDAARNLLGAIQASDRTSASIVSGLTATAGVAVPSGPTISEASKRFLENRLHFKGRSGHTIDDYRRTLKGFQAILGNMRINQVSAKDVRDFRDRLAQTGLYRMRRAPRAPKAQPQERTLSHRTVVKHVKNLRTFLNWAVKEELIEKNPAANIDLPTVGRNPIRPPPSELADALCTIAKPPCDVVEALDWEVLPNFYRYTGARCGEIARLTAADVVEVAGIRCLRIFTEKTGMRGEQTRGEDKRTVPVHSKLAPHLDRLLAERGQDPTALLFSGAGTRRSPCGTYMRYASAWANLYNRLCKTVWPQMKVHAWRSYAISQMAMNDISEEIRRRVVGHAIIGVHDGYTHIDVAKLRKAVEAIG